MTTTEYVGPAQLARALGVAHQTVNKAESMGKITRSPNGKFDLNQARQDWITSSHPLRVKVKPKEPGPEGRLQAENGPLVEFWIKLFNDSAGPTAILLRQSTNLTTKEIWHFMGTVFLVQWEVVSQLLVNGQELPIQLCGAAELLASDEGQRELEAWLERQGPNNQYVKSEKGNSCTFQSTVTHGKSS